MKIGLMVILANDRRTNAKRPYDSIRAVAQKAEVDGFDSIWLADHLMYRYEGEPTRGIWECWSMLAALAEATERVELGTLVICNSFRQPAILAKMATAVDEVSGGRLTLGVGSGWNDPEYRAFGLPLDHRVDRFEEALQILRPMLREGRVDFSGKYYQAQDCEDLPRGPRPQGPPLMVGSSDGPRMLRLTVQYADQWNTGYMGGPETMAGSKEKIEAACREAGRDPRTLGITTLLGVWFPDLDERKPPFENYLTGTPQEMASAMRGYSELGIDHIMLQCSPYVPEAIQRVTEALRLYRG